MTVVYADTYSTNLGAYVPARLKSELRELAYLNRRSLSEDVRVALTTHVRNESERTQRGAAA